MRKVNQDAISRGFFNKEAKTERYLQGREKLGPARIPKGDFLQHKNWEWFMKTSESGLECGGKQVWGDMKIADRSIFLPFLSLLMICTLWFPFAETPISGLSCDNS